MRGPIMFSGSAGSPYFTSASIARATSTTSSWRARGTTSRDVIAHPWPECEMTAYAQNIAAVVTSPSSSITNADLPPSSRNTRFSVSLAAAMILRPTGVEPVNEMTSTSGCVVMTSPTALSDDESTFTTPAGTSVASAINLPSASTDHGVSGDAFSTTVQPAASAGA